MRFGFLAVAFAFVAGLAIRAAADTPGTVCSLYCDLHIDDGCEAPPGGVAQLGTVSFPDTNHVCPATNGTTCPHCAAIRAAADEVARAPLPDGPHIIGGALYQTQDGVSFYVADVVPVAKQDVLSAIQVATAPDGTLSATPVDPNAKVGP